MTDELLKLHLTTFVPLRIIELRRNGGPTSQDLARAKAYVPDFCEHGDDLLYRSKKPGRTGELMGKLVDAVAILAFWPSGVTVFGLRFETNNE